MARKRHRFATVFSWLLAPFYVVCGVAMLLAYLSPFVNPASFVLPAFFGLYFIVIACINLLLVLVAIVRRSRLGWFTFLCLLPLLLFAGRFANWKHPAASQPGTETLSLLTYNVGTFSESKEKLPYQQIRDSVMKAVAQVKPDIICFQEFYCCDTLFIHLGLAGYPYKAYFFPRHNKKGYYGNLILSRFPLTGIRHRLFSDGKKSALFTYVHTDGNPKGKPRFCLCTIHLESTRVSLVALGEKIYNRQLAQEEVVTTHEHLSTAFKKRSGQVQELCSDLAANPVPVILCGDFNDTPLSHTYQSFTRIGLHDTFLSAGNGFGGTFRFLRPLLRIDYVFADPVFIPISHDIPHWNHSDHYPVITRLAIPLTTE